MAFNVDDRSFAEVELKQLYGGGGLGYFTLRLGFEFRLRKWEGAPAEITRLAADVRASPDGRSQFNVGHFVSHSAVSVTNPQRFDHDPIVYLEAELSPSRVAAIDAVRNGRDFTLSANLEGAAVRAGQSHRFTQEIYRKVTQSDWLAILEQMQFQKSILIEVPAPNLNADPRLHQAYQALDKAQAAFSRGAYRDAVGACRESLEGMGHAFGDLAQVQALNPPSTIPNLFDGSRSMDLDTRRRVVRKAATLFTHPAHHADEVSVQCDYSREDASAAIAITAALLRSSG